MAQATRSKEQLQADIAAARERLASNIEGLITQAHPKAVVARGVHDAKDFAVSEVKAAKAAFVDLDGAPNLVRIGALAAAVVGSIALLVVIRSITRG